MFPNHLSKQFEATSRTSSTVRNKNSQAVFKEQKLEPCRRKSKANQFLGAKFWDIVREMKDLQCNKDGSHNARENHVDQRWEPNRCSNLTFPGFHHSILQMIPMFASKVSWQKGLQKLTQSFQSTANFFK